MGAAVGALIDAAPLALIGPARGDSAPRRTYANTQLKQENVPIAWLSLLLKAEIIKEL